MHPDDGELYWHCTDCQNISLSATIMTHCRCGGRLKPITNPSGPVCSFCQKRSESSPCDECLEQMRQAEVLQNLQRQAAKPTLAEALHNQRVNEIAALLAPVTDLTGEDLHNFAEALYHVANTQPQLEEMLKAV